MWYESLRSRPCLGATFLVANLALFSATNLTLAQGTTQGDEMAVRQSGQSYVEALRRGDAKALEAAWTPDGRYVDATGKSSRARTLFQQSLGPDSASTIPANFAFDVNSSIRLIAPHVAVEEGAMAGNSTGRTSLDGTYTAVWVKQSDRWLLDTLCESQSGINDGSNPVELLGWLIGEWIATGDGFQARCTADWSENRRFIVSQFKVERSGGHVLNGTQRIGWDPAASRIRSWVFDSDGGISQGIWRKEGDAWVVKTAGILPDGRRSSAANFWLPEGDDRFVLKSTHTKVNDVALEDLVLEFHRVRDSE